MMLMSPGIPGRGGSGSAGSRGGRQIDRNILLKLGATKQTLPGLCQGADLLQKKTLLSGCISK